MSFFLWCPFVCPSSRVPLVSWFPSLCCAESEDSIDGEFNSENSLQLRLCFLFQPSVLFSQRDPMYCTLSINRLQVQILPTEQATPVLTSSFSRGYDPYTHACKARPLTTVGRTSLSVIIIIIIPEVLTTRCQASGLLSLPVFFGKGDGGEGEGFTVVCDSQACSGPDVGLLVGATSSYWHSSGACTA